MIKKYLLSLLLLSSCFNPVVASHEFQEEENKEIKLLSLSFKEGILITKNEENEKETNTQIISCNNEETKKEDSLLFESSVKKSATKGWKLKGSIEILEEVLQNIASFLTPKDILKIALTSRGALSAIATPSFDTQILGEGKDVYKWVIMSAYRDDIHDKTNISKEDAEFNFPPIRLQEHGNIKNAYYKLSKQFGCFDENFIQAKKYLEGLDETVVLINLSNRKLKAVPSLNRFLDLLVLDLHENNLSFFDSSKNTMLSMLSLRKNNLNFFDPSENKKLKYLRLDENNLYTIDISENTELEDLYLEKNKFSSEEKETLKKQYPFATLD
jgi:hypothetical protein